MDNDVTFMYVIGSLRNSSQYGEVIIKYTKGYIYLCLLDFNRAISNDISTGVRNNTITDGINTDIIT